MIRLSLYFNDSILRHKSQEAARTASWKESYENFSFLFLQNITEPIFLQVLWQFLSSRRSRSNFGGLAVLAAAGGKESPRENSERRRPVLSEIEVSRTAQNRKRTL
jgi:hypothetical protein